MGLASRDTQRQAWLAPVCSTSVRSATPRQGPPELSRFWRPKAHQSSAQAALLLGHQDFALADMVCSRDNALVFHLFDQPRRLVIADRQLALNV